VWHGSVVVAYERDGQFGQEIVVARSDGEGPFVSEVIAVTARTARLDPIVHLRDGKMWIDWKESDNLIAFVRYNRGKWKRPRIWVWDDPSWLGELTARHQIESGLTH
jgi:hypothetical protein